MVTSTALLAAPSIAPGTRRALVNGLQWAQLLRRHFPDAYEAHVAGPAARRLATRGQLYGVALYFLSLAHKHRIALHTNGLANLSLGDPEQNLRASGIGEASAEQYLAESLEYWRHTPLPRVYGMVRDLTVLHRRGFFMQTLGWQHNRPAPLKRNALAIALWRLVSGGPWEVIEDRQLKTEATYFHTAELGQAIVQVAKPLRSAASPGHIPWPELCRRLDQLQPEGWKDLGSVLAYLCGQTDNPYADRSQLELGTAGGGQFDLAWTHTSEHFKTERRKQQIAARLAGRYDAVDRAVCQNPALIAPLCDAVRSVARELAQADLATAEPYRPGALVNLMIWDDPGTEDES